jgi:putative chitinase
MLNGDELSGDGWKFKGRGAIMLTGKDNYTKFDKFVTEDIISNPDLVSTKYPLLSGAFFWGTNNINIVADKGDSSDVVTAVRKKVNGGVIGLQDVQTKFIKYYNLLK